MVSLKSQVPKYVAFNTSGVTRSTLDGIFGGGLIYFSWHIINSFDCLNTVWSHFLEELWLIWGKGLIPPKSSLIASLFSTQNRQVRQSRTCIIVVRNLFFISLIFKNNVLHHSLKPLIWYIWRAISKFGKVTSKFSSQDTPSNPLPPVQYSPAHAVPTQLLFYRYVNKKKIKL